MRTFVLGLAAIFLVASLAHGWDWKSLVSRGKTPSPSLLRKRQQELEQRKKDGKEKSAGNAS